MRHLLSLSLAAVLVCSGHASHQIIEVTPQTLEGWTLTGADQVALTSGDQLVLPAGAQLSRQFSGSAIILHLVTRPTFSTRAEDWPIIGLGSSALVFTRKDGQGQMVLVTGDDTATVLPWSLPPDRPDKPELIDLFLACDPESGMGLISCQNQIKSFNLPANAKSAEVWLSAGTPSNWPLALFQVILFDPMVTPTAYPRAVNGSHADATDPRPALTANLQAVMGQMRAATEAAGVIAATPGNEATVAKSGPVSRLEVYTPSSVRRVRVINAVRSAVAEALAK